MDKLGLMTYRTTPTERQARFFWQGALIILPALVLAGAGLYSLRQDDVLARHEAETLAKQIASELAHRLIPQALQFELPEPEMLKRPVLTPGEEPLHRLTRSPLIGSAFLTDAEGVPLYPPVAAGIPRPEPVDEAQLTPVQQDDWLALEDSWSKDIRSSDRLLAAFLAAGPPARLAEVARFRTAVVLARSDQVPAAVEKLRITRDLPADICGESGIPLRWLADWQLADLLPEGTRAGALHGLASQLLLKPSPVADALVARIADLDPAMRGWREVWETHEKARQFAMALKARPDGDVVILGGQVHLPVIQKMDDGAWAVAVPLAGLKTEVARLDRLMVRPAAFGTAIAMASQQLLPRPESSPTLAEAAAASLPVTVEVFLKDPAAFAAQRSAKTMRFAALIALSAGMVVVGFFSAWRAFRRQQHLSEMKSNFVSSVSHELRAPIASVRLMAEELEHGSAPSSDKLRQYSRFIGQECRRLSAVIENVLDFSRREQGREKFTFEETDLTALVEGTVAVMLAYGTERNVRIESMTAGAPCPIMADAHALQRMLVNLIDNSLKHSPDDATVIVGLEFAAGKVALWVEDSGPGIPRDEHSRIFERFYRIGSELQRQTQGVGLGLSIVKHLAEIHGGTVHVRSEVGRGSRFTAELPLRPVSTPDTFPFIS